MITLILKIFGRKLIITVIFSGFKISQSYLLADKLVKSTKNELTHNYTAKKLLAWFISACWFWVG